MILVEIEEPSLRVMIYATSYEVIREEVDLSNEVREMAHIGRRH